MYRARLLLLILAASLGCVPGARAGEDEESIRAFARGELIREATRTVKDAANWQAALVSMRNNLREDVAFAASFQPQGAEEEERLRAFEATIAERTLLLGLPTAAEEEAGVAAGALVEASVLGQWLVGALPSAIAVRQGAAETGPERIYTYPPPPTGPQPVPVPAGESIEPAPGTPTAEGTEPTSVPAPAETPAPGAAASPPESPARVGPVDIPTWVREVVRAGEGGTLLDRRFTLHGAPALEALVQAGASAPVFVHPEVGTLRRHALLGEQQVSYNATLAALRSLQADEHSKAMQSDQPQPSMVDGGIVREKEQLVARYQELIDRHTGRRQRIFEELDEMVDDLDGWKTQAALLIGEIEELRKAPGEGVGGALSPSQELRLRLAQARETCVTLDILLLYQAAARADARLQMLAVLLRAAREESTAAESLLARYNQALLALRSSRRLDRIGSDNRKLRRWILAGEKREATPGTIGAARVRAYRSLLELNEIVQEAVRMRGLMSAAPTPVEGAVPPPAADARQDAELGLSGLVLRPDKAAWDEKFVELAGRELRDPALRSTFDARLVAHHYALVDQRISALVQAQVVARDEARMQGRFQEGYARSEAALNALQGDYLSTHARKLPGMLVVAREDFDAAMHGISEQRAANQSRLRALLRYRSELRHQGTRSLLIRIDRSLADPDVEAALRGTRAVLDDAGRWISFEGEEHAGDFLSRSWLKILLVLAALLLCLVLARAGRGLVDRWIQARVASFPGLAAEGASVREERERGREARQALDVIASQTSADVVLQQVPPADPSVDVPPVDVPPVEAAPSEAEADAALSEPEAGASEPPADPTPKGEAR